jgi:hypothetical protein
MKTAYSYMKTIFDFILSYFIEVVYHKRLYDRRVCCERLVELFIQTTPTFDSCYGLINMHDTCELCHVCFNLARVM